MSKNKNYIDKSKTLIGESSFTDFIKSQGGNAIKSGFDAGNSKFGVNNDAFPEGMVELKRQHK